MCSSPLFCHSFFHVWNDRYLVAGDKRLPEAALAERLAKGADIVKRVYRWVSVARRYERCRSLTTRLFGSELPNYDLIIPALLNGGVEKLSELCKLTPG